MTIEENWPFVIPPILALIDDEDTTLKIKGCEALMTLLKVVPSNLLQRTGLYEVFEEALVPGLSYLPTLTPEEESINLLHKVYPTLVELNSVRYSAEAEAAARSRMLHRLVREGVIKGYLHASGHVKVADFLFKTLSHLIDKLGISFIVHLKVFHLP